MDNYALYVLNVCEVCGSYQCPYCPFFSGAHISLVSLPLLASILICTLFAATAH